MNIFLQNKPTVLTAFGGMRVEEHFGSTATNDEAIAISNMVAPSGWTEDYFIAQSDIWTLINLGKKMIEINGYKLVMEAGQSMLIKKGTRIKYSNPFNQACDYWTLCLASKSEATQNNEYLVAM